MLQPSHIEHLNPSELVEARVRLVVGLKRYFHGKRLEGLLSSAVCFPDLFMHSSVMDLADHGHVSRDLAWLDCET